MRNLSGKDLHFPGMSMGASNCKKEEKYEYKPKVRITSEKESACIDRGRHGVKKLKTRLRVLGGFVISSKKGKKRQDSIGKKWQDLELTFFMLKELVALRNQGKIIDPLMSLLFFKM